MLSACGPLSIRQGGVSLYFNKLLPGPRTNQKSTRRPNNGPVRDRVCKLWRSPPFATMVCTSRLLACAPASLMSSPVPTKEPLKSFPSPCLDLVWVFAVLSSPSVLRLPASNSCVMTGCSLDNADQFSASHLRLGGNAFLPFDSSSSVRRRRRGSDLPRASGARWCEVSLFAVCHNFVFPASS